ncbi:tRNA 2-selenouridine(34) synthase MnmH [Calothrix rhizosoleniae]|uniref:tRNA 2-selenouridine(34) synthase MnmH n=1 Tax=Calothrix rhizosoleniae TaxID=888997 RepID=UPI000B4974BD|nr:tRNA 2-selenouridine(34) synthase MnmH [Calothrix rhizosoleniae]
MPPSPKHTNNPWGKVYSEIIDVRSPNEFSLDCIPGAINLPVLDDAERAEVGTIYKQVSAFKARKVGAALVAKNISQHLTQHFITKDKDYSPLVYCWRGGQRSASMASVLSQIGWKVTILEGGYKTYRTYVREKLEELPQKFTYHVISGLTGSAKTNILRQLSQRGAQVLDLEDLANHRGSLLGEVWVNKSLPQPSQKYFESLLLQELQNFNPAHIVWVESESNKIGKVYLPSSLWQQMKQSNCIEIQVPIQARVQFIIQEYSHFTNHPDILKTKIAGLKSRYGSKKINEWNQLIESGNFPTFVDNILQSHYDPAYLKSTQTNYIQGEQSLAMPDLSAKSVENLVDTLMQINSNM